MQYLESRVTPLLAGILAFIDTNNNLDVLFTAVDSSEQWLRDMWFHMLSDSSVTVLKYRSVLRVCLSDIAYFCAMLCGVWYCHGKSSHRLECFKNNFE